MDSSDYHERTDTFIRPIQERNLDYDLYDAHCHLGFTQQPEALADAAELQGIGAFCCTVTPAEYLGLQVRLQSHPNVDLGLGLHPWWVGEDETSLDQFLELLPATRFVGEIGLDFSPRFETTDDMQIEAITRILNACAEQGDKIISIHCVQAYDELLGILDSTGVCDSCQVIIHWFSGTSDQLMYAYRIGCCFSVGPRMLSTKRGRAYVRQIPRERIFLETDAPLVDAKVENFLPVPFDFEEWRELLEEANRLLEAEPTSEQKS